MSFGAGDAGDFGGDDSSTSPVVKRPGKGKIGADKREKKPEAPRVKGEASGSGRGGGWERRKTFAKVDEEMEQFRKNPVGPVKRSGRATMAPLKYWANEHVEYKRALTALPVISAVIPPVNEPVEVVVKRTSTKRSAADKAAAKAKVAKKAKKEQASSSASSSSSESSGASEARIETAVSIQLGTIFSSALERDVTTTLAVPMPKLVFYTFPDESGKVAKKAPAMVGCRIAKALDLDPFSSGIISIAPLARTSEQDPHESTISFFVVKGTVEVFVYKSRFTLGKGATFFIPNNNCYMLSNPSQKNELVLHFTATNPPQRDDDNGKDGAAKD